MSYAVAVDVGGTFTDYVVAGAGRVHAGKVLSTPGDESAGILDAIEEAAEALETPHLLQETTLFILGTTVATNTMLEFDGATTGMVTTGGFRDVIDLRRNFKESLYDLKLPPPHPIIPRRRRIGVAERIDYQGEVVTPLNESEVSAALMQLRTMGVESVAVCLLFSFANEAHEQRIAELARELCPEVHVSLSHRVLPKAREFERFSTTVIDAYVTPRVGRYLRALQDRLRLRSFAGDLLVMASNGGMLPAEVIADRGVEACLSGPSGGVVAAASVGEACDQANLITLDMGGTSCDVCLIKDARPEISSNYWLSRYRVALPMVDIQTIGAGGGSIAHVDRGGALRVGPDSAGADPGPACYGRGGVHATVTDANLILGYLNPDYFFGGRLRLDQKAAEAAIMNDVGRPLGFGVTEAASSIFRIINGNMTNAIRYVSVAKGRDPRDFALMAYGGGGPVHATALAADLSMGTVLVPRMASKFSALGAMLADFKTSQMQACHMRSDRLDLEQINAVFAQLLTRSQSLTMGKEWIEDQTPHRFVEMRYVRQVHEVTIDLGTGAEPLTEVDVTKLLGLFHHRHEELYGFQRPGFPVEIMGLRLDLVGRRHKMPLLEAKSSRTSGNAALKAERPVYYFSPAGFLLTPIYDGQRVVPGQQIEGPAVIEEPDTAVVVHPGQVATLNQYDVYVVQTLAGIAPKGGA